jgi:hypothetical protein
VLLLEQPEKMQRVGLNRVAAQHCAVNRFRIGNFALTVQTDSALQALQHVGRVTMFGQLKLGDKKDLFAIRSAATPGIGAVLPFARRYHNSNSSGYSVLCGCHRLFPDRLHRPHPKIKRNCRILPQSFNDKGGPHGSTSLQHCSITCSLGSSE